ncbi:hypothetical protein EYC84_007398 [Monilinia fructicola]|uniref:Uncharacterized protein n=1 Tax=Monilinia fructicola TaxID=38448 RepID=A0A5M9JKM4_MONFR|nr:hypothetical protein EYC84_007398 [Monilinia fructicola]
MVGVGITVIGGGGGGGGVDSDWDVETFVAYLSPSPTASSPTASLQQRRLQQRRLQQRRLQQRRLQQRRLQQRRLQQRRLRLQQRRLLVSNSAIDTLNPTHTPLHQPRPKTPPSKPTPQHTSPLKPTSIHTETKTSCLPTTSRSPPRTRTDAVDELRYARSRGRLPEWRGDMLYMPRLGLRVRVRGGPARGSAGGTNWFGGGGEA